MSLESLRVARLTDLKIPAGQTVSNIITADEYGKYDNISINAPTVLDGTVTVTAGVDDSVTGATRFNAIQSPPGTDVTIPTNKTIVLTGAPFPYIQLVQVGAAGADRIFTIWGQVGLVSSR